MKSVDIVTGLPFTSSSTSFPMPVRKQWDANHGYCGETSLIMAGMSFGQYTSQFSARSLASPGVSQNSEDSQLLLGVNDKLAATKMKLAALAYKPEVNKKVSRISGFLSWINKNIASGHRVIVGLFNKGGNEEEYDHIVPVLGADSKSTETVLANGNFRGGLTFSDNYGKVFHAPYQAFVKSRSAANRGSSPVYSLPNGTTNYGMAVTGVLDPDKKTLPIRLSASRNDEPVLSEGANKPPKPAPLKLKATVSIPDQSKAYRVYYYNNFAKVPDRAFNAAALNAMRSWTISPHSGPTATFEVNCLTSDTAIFRAVPLLSA
jgi:hypothetical protein